MGMAKSKEEQLSYFSDRYKVIEGHWIWDGPLHPQNNAPVIYIGKGKTGYNLCVSARRFAWEFNKKKLDRSAKLKPSCGIHLCVNPDHNELFMPGLKLSKEQAEDIRNLYATGEWTVTELSREYKVTRQHIYNILSNRNWK